MPGIHANRRLREVVTLLLVGFAIYLAVSLATFSRSDPGWLYIGPREAIQNQGGAVGAWFADVLLGIFGHMAFLFPIMVAWHGLLMVRDGDHPHNHPADMLLRWVGFAVMLASGSALSAMLAPDPLLLLPAGSGNGGILGGLIKQLLVGRFSITGSSLLMAASVLAGFTLFTGFSPFVVFDWVGEVTFAVFRVVGWFLGLFRRRPQAKPAPEDMPVDRAVAEPREPTMNAQAAAAVAGEDAVPHSRAALRRARAEKRKAGRMEPVMGNVPADLEEEPVPEPVAQTAERLDARFEANLTADLGAAVEQKVARAIPEPEPDRLPPIDLLDPARPSGHAFSPEALEELSRQVELRLLDFRIEVKVVGIQPGPVVTMFELELAPGTKASKVTNLAKDLARALSTVSVRVVEVIPGKSVIGLEIPNEKRETVYLCEVLGSKAYDHSASPLTLALGKDIAGNPTVSDLARMPHALIAGTTGSGKSVAINAMILSLLYKATPKEVRLIMVDPKMLELSVYEGIPHLLTPVVTDMKEAANALRWCVVEMDRRYKLMAAMGVRNIAGFNKKVKAAAKAGTPLKDPLFQPDPLGIGPQIPPELETLPYIVVIIDELADMMMVVGKKVEELIARLAQKARAAGVHLLLATQRPSVDVITGLIKANIPSRIAFQVSSKVDSRTILDQMGAEALLGNGDMLYLPPGSGIPQRMHGAFVDDDEVHRVVSWLKETGEPEYIDIAVPDEGEEDGGFSAGGDVEVNDALYDEAVRFVTESRRASISAVQRKLKIGYNRAARMIEEMERTGVVSPAESNGNREVLAPPPPSF